MMNLSRVDEWVETFGLTIVEAMAFGVPVIVPPVGGPTEIVRDGIDGYFISSYETQKIAQNIKDLANNEATCLILSENARERVQFFNETIFVDKITTLFSE
jgi:glycosyltransferase involved in cell wall biosynthesis